MLGDKLCLLACCVAKPGAVIWIEYMILIRNNMAGRISWKSFSFTQREKKNLCSVEISLPINNRYSNIMSWCSWRARKQAWICSRVKKTAESIYMLSSMSKSHVGTIV